MNTDVEPSILEYSAKFCKELDKTKNFVSCPLMAAEIIMAMMDLGSFDSGGPIFSNRIQITDGRIIPSLFLSLSPSLKSIKGVTLNRSSKAYLQKNHYKLSRYTKKTALDVFNVQVETIDFMKRDAVKFINKWMEKDTRRSIKGCFNCESFNADTGVVLVNCLYFKGIWQMKFDPEDTEETLFYLNNTETVNVFLMYRKEKYKYKESNHLEAQMVLLPFKNEDAHMLIVLPKIVTSLDKILQKLADGYDLMAEVNQMCQDVEIIVNIPRFKIESEINIADVLSKLGVHTTFDKTVQKLFIEVNEEGTEPKPKPMRGCSIPRWKPRPIEFTANRPHLIVILCHNIPIIWVTFRGRFD